MRTMIKQTIMAFAALLFMGAAAYAQGGPGGGPNAQNRERVEALRVAYITNALQLTPDEAQKFWPVYNQYRGDLKTLRQNFKLDAADETDPDFVDKKLEFEQKKLDLQKKYRPQFEAAIGPKKLALLISAEDRFKQELLRRMNERGR
jgi:Spy/CpxP family protein refolding chaperone